VATHSTPASRIRRYGGRIERFQNKFGSGQDYFKKKDKQTTVEFIYVTLITLLA